MAKPVAAGLLVIRLSRPFAEKSAANCTDEAQNKAETRVCGYLAPCKIPLFMTQLAANFAAKGLLNLMTSSPVATGLAH